MNRCIADSRSDPCPDDSGTFRPHGLGRGASCDLTDLDSGRAYHHHEKTSRERRRNVRPPVLLWPKDLNNGEVTPPPGGRWHMNFFADISIWSDQAGRKREALGESAGLDFDGRLG
jgi:hypothetical protein